MRVSCDLDSKNSLKLGYYLLKGTLIFFKLPSKIRITRRGFHYIWSGLFITEQKSYYYRKILGDDLNRIRLDMVSDKRLKQVLFKEKKVYHYEYDSFGNFERKTRVQ